MNNCGEMICHQITLAPVVSDSVSVASVVNDSVSVASVLNGVHSRDNAVPLDEVRYFLDCFY